MGHMFNKCLFVNIIKTKLNNGQFEKRFKNSLDNTMILLVSKRVGRRKVISYLIRSGLLQIL